MSIKRVSPMDIYKLLPRTNCGECGESTCMAFAIKLVNMEAVVEQCKPLLTPEYKSGYDQIKSILKPAVAEVTVGVGENAVKIGGEYIMYRHELTYLNPTPIAIDIPDTMPDDAVVERIRKVESLKYNYIGRDIMLDMFAVRCTSNDPELFSKTVKLVTDRTSWPLVLCSLNPKAIEAALKAVADQKPLVYAATVDNWSEMIDLCLRYKVPLTLLSHDLDKLVSLAKTATSMGLEEIALDPGTLPKEYLSHSLNAYTMLRWRACKEGYELAGHPLVGSTVTTWLLVDGDKNEKSWWEACTAANLIVRFVDLIIMHSIEGWAILPLLILRDNIYTDPRKPVSVEPGLRVIGDPDENSPVMFTTNFALTYYTVLSDLEAAKINCYLLVVDTEGLSVESAVAGRKLTADVVAEALKESGVGDKVKHRKLIIPGRASRLSGEIEEVSGWKVLVGPLDSSGIPKFLSEKWPGED